MRATYVRAPRWKCGFAKGRTVSYAHHTGIGHLMTTRRFANVDFAMASGLKRWSALRMHVSGYDINCQYRIHFDERMAWLAEHTKDFQTIDANHFPATVAAVGKFHLPAHKPSCQYKFSYHWLPGVGMTDGEAPERIWAILNALSGSTREMTSGHRHDVINDHHSDANVHRTHGIGEFQFTHGGKRLT